MESVGLQHSRVEEQRFDLKVERRVLQRELGPSDEDLEQTYKDMNLKRRNQIVGSLIDAERLLRARAMLATVQRAFSEAKCPVRIEVNWNAIGMKAELVAETLRIHRTMAREPITRTLVDKHPTKASRSQRPKIPTHHGHFVAAKPEQIEAFEVQPLFWEQCAWSDWTYTLADHSIIFTWIELPPRPAEFHAAYASDWTWFPALRSATNRYKQTVVSWKNGTVTTETRYAADLTAGAVKTVALQRSVREARKNANRRLPREDCAADDESGSE